LSFLFLGSAPAKSNGGLAAELSEEIGIVVRSRLSGDGLNVPNCGRRFYGRTVIMK
jgi:hypothetical protein